MEALKTLVAMQLKEKLNLKGANFSKKNILFKTIFALIKFIAIIALCYAALFVCKFLHLFSLIDYVPASVIAIVFFAMMILQVVSVTWQLTKSLYFSKDNPILLVMPCKHTHIYLSKLIVFYIFELLKNLSFMVPFFFAYGLLCGLPFIYYPWMMFCFIFISMFSVLLGSILSIPVMWVYSFLKQYKKVQFLSIILMIALITYGLAKAINIIPENIDLVATWHITSIKIRDFLAAFTNKFEFIYDTVVMMVGKRVDLRNIMFTSKTFITFGEIVLIVLSLFGIGFVTARPLFYTMASKPLEYTRNSNKQGENKVTNKNVSIFKTELILNLRDSDRVISNVILFVAMPVLIFLLNKIFAAMDTKMLGNSLAIMFNILIILLITLSSNYYAASVYSRYGKSSYLTKVQPSNVIPLLLSKLFFNTIFVIASYIATLIILVKFSALTVGSAIVIALACIFIYFAHLFYSAELDVMKPHVELYATISETGTNPNETKSTLIAFLVAFLTSGMLLFLLVENSGIITYVKIMLIGLAFMLFRLYMLVTKIKLYYREIDL